MAKNHTSDSCTKIKDGHKDEATKRNKMGGSDWNKGWYGRQNGPEHSNTEWNIPTNVNLVVLNCCRTNKSKPAYPPIKINHPPAQIKPADTIVVEYGANGIYFGATAPVDNLNTAAPQIWVSTASGELTYSLASAQLDLPHLPSYFTKYGHVMPAFNHSLMGLVSIYDNECSVQFHKYTVKIYDPQGLPLLQGWQDNKVTKI